MYIYDVCKVRFVDEMLYLLFSRKIAQTKKKTEFLYQQDTYFIRV